MARTKEQIREYNKYYYYANRDKMLIRAKEWRESHPEEMRIHARERRKKNPERQKELNRRHYHKWHIAKTYGVTQEWHNAKLEKQNYKCAICKCDPKPHRKLVVDHDHSNGKVRGLLCDACNTALNRLENISDWEVLAREYISEYSNG